MSQDTSKDEDRKNLDELVEKARFGMLTTGADGDRLVSRPMTIAEYADGLFRFITQRSTDVAQQSDGKQVNLALVDDSSWVSISGSARISDDLAVKQRLWDPAMDAYTEGGPENPDNVVLELDPDTASYWDSPGGVVQLLDVVKANLTGSKPQAGEYGKVDL